MNNPHTKRKIYIGLATLGFILGIAAIQAQADSAGNSKILLKRESSGLMILTISDPEGIREFSLRPKKGSSYGGGIDCPRKFQNNNVVFSNDAFEGNMDAIVTDCQGNTDEFTIGPPEDGVTKGDLVKKEVVEEKKAAPAKKEDISAEKKKETPAPVKGGGEDPAVRAKKLKSVSYPVAELGNCNDQLECQIFCDSSVNIRVCTDFAEKHGLMSKSETENAKKFADVPAGESPGGCTTQDSCMAYCESVDHLDECVVFGEKYGFLSGDELQEAKIVLRLRQEGKAFPGGCTTKAQCEAYCTGGDHIEECLLFGESSGLIPAAELEMAKKMLPLIKEGKTPGGCKSKEQCEAYCQDPQNMKKCLAFGEEHNIIPKEELEMAKKFLPLLEQGKTPGKCRTKDQCEAYCQEESNINECISFGVEAGFISAADAELARKTGGKGPGGCKSKEQCEAFCKQKDNMEVCQAFAREHGIETNGPGGCRDIDECQAYCTTPEHQNECESFAKERGLDVAGPGGCEGKEQCSAYCKAEEHRSECEGFFKEHNIEFNGPGGCKSFEECQSYCKSQDNLQECLSFTGGQGGGLPQDTRGGPGGCKSHIECEEYCREHIEECNKFGGGGGDDRGDGDRGGGDRGGGFSGPGGCKSPQECMTYCQNNHDDPACGGGFSGGNGGGGFPGGGDSSGGGFPGGGDFPGGGGSSGGGGGFGGPGGCSSPAECQAYCQSHPQECGGVPFSPPPHPTQSCAQVPSGLVSWPDDDKTSNTASGVVLVSGKVGNALKFNASGGYVKDEDSEKLNFGTGPFSLEAWFNWDGGGSSKGNIIRKSNYPVNGDGAGYWLVIGKDKSILEFFVGETVGNPGKPRGNISVPISSGVWHYVVATRSGSGLMSLYIDGQLKGTAEATGANTTSAAPFTLGAWDDRFGITELFSGLIDEVSVYNRALSSSEVQSIFNAGSNGKCSGSETTPAPVPTPPTRFVCDYAPPPQGCTYIQGPNFNSQTKCGLELSCPTNKLPPPPPSLIPGVQFEDIQNIQIPGFTAPHSPPPATSDVCASFSAVPSCSMVGATDSESYKFCKQCYPDK